MFLDYPDSGTAFCRLVNLINSVDGAKQDKYTYLARSIAYTCLSATKEEHPVSTMATWWKRLVMSRATKTWAMSAWMGKPLPDKITHCKPTTPPLTTSSAYLEGSQEDGSHRPNWTSRASELPPQWRQCGHQALPPQEPPQDQRRSARSHHGAQKQSRWGTATSVRPIFDL
jgi:hypothetical protein